MNKLLCLLFGRSNFRCSNIYHVNNGRRENNVKKSQLFRDILDFVIGRWEEIGNEKKKCGEE